MTPHEQLSRPGAARAPMLGVQDIVGLFARGMDATPYLSVEALAAQHGLAGAGAGTFMMRTDVVLQTIRKIYGAVLDRLDVGVILLDVDARPSFVNARAAAIVARGDGVNVAREGVTAARPSETRALQAAVAAATDTTSGKASVAAPRRLYLSRPSGLSPLAVTVITVDGGDGEPPCAALLVADPEAPTRIDTRGLGDAYGLTPREATVAALLSRGADIAQAADTLGIGVSSARQYLKRALEKTGTHRQANLVRLVLRSFADSYA